MKKMITDLKSSKFMLSASIGLVLDISLVFLLLGLELGIKGI